MATDTPEALAARCWAALTTRPDAGPDAGPDAAFCDLVIDRLNQNLRRGAREDALLAAMYNNRAVRHLRAREYERASADIEEAINLTPETAELYLTRGNLHLAQRQFLEARGAFDAALDLSGGRLTAAWLNRSLANRGLGLVAEADIDLQMATGRPPSGGASLPADDAAPVALSAPARAGAAPDSRSR